MGRRGRPHLPIAALALASSVWSVPAGADDSAAARCVAAAERGQRERDAGKLLDARASFASCGEDVCPAVVRRECIAWLAQVDERVPGVVIAVQDGEGHDVLDADVAVDGTARPDASTGRELRLDPGPHRLRATHRGFGDAEEQLVLRERERGRAVKLLLRQHAASAATEPVAAPPPPPRAGRRVPAASYALGAVAVASAGGFAYLWSTGVHDVHHLRRTCAPACEGSAVDDAERTLNFGRASLGVAVVAAVAAVVLYLIDAPAHDPAAVTAKDLALRF